MYITRYNIQDMCIFPQRFDVILKANGGTLYITRYNIQDMCIFPQRFVVMLKEKGNTLYRNWRDIQDVRFARPCVVLPNAHKDNFFA